MRLKGKWELCINGLWMRGENLLVDSGLAGFAEILRTNDGSLVAPSHFAVGSDPTVPVAAQTALLAEVLTPRTAFTTVVRTGNILEYTVSKVNSSGSSQTIRECGIFNDVAAGTMFSRFKPPEFEFDIGATLLLKWSLEFGI